MLDRLRSWPCCLVITLIGILGCGSGIEPPKNRPKTVKVTGVVTYKGAPLDGAAIKFANATDASKPGASGLTDAKGEFFLSTFASGDGIIPGDYQIAISKMSAPPSSGKGSTGDADYEPPSEKDVAVRKSLIPEKYGDPKTSGIKINVPDTPGPPLTFDLD